MFEQDSMNMLEFPVIKERLSGYMRTEKAASRARELAPMQDIEEIARAQGEDPDAVFKTLVTQGKSGGYYVFLVPVAAELDLKKAAAAAGEKAIAMIKARELLPLTGYVHGGCSPIGMKKRFPTFVDETAQLFDTIHFSGGKVGCQIRMNPDDLARLVPFQYADLTV